MVHLVQSVDKDRRPVALSKSFYYTAPKILAGLISAAFWSFNSCQRLSMMRKSSFFEFEDPWPSSVLCIRHWTGGGAVLRVLE